MISVSIDQSDPIVKSPIVSLWMAVLAAAFHDLRNSSKRIREEARGWIFSNFTYLNSYLTLCKIFGVSASAGRRAAILALRKGPRVKGEV